MLTEFAGNLASTVAVGQAFNLVLKSIDDADRIDISLSTGKTETADHLLHLSVRFESETLVRNAKLHGHWGTEEHDRAANAVQNFQPGSKLVVYVLVGSEGFHIAINEVSYCFFKYRDAIENIKAITIQRDVQQVYCVDHRQCFPRPFPSLQVNDRGYSFSNDAPVPFQPGHVIVIRAIPFGNPKGSFIFQFFEDGTRRQLLHFNPRFDPYYVVVRNSHTEAMEFRTEERSGGFPFIIDQQFCLAIGFAKNEFKFAVNGSIFEPYAYKENNMLAGMTGFKVKCMKQLQVEITSVDHIHLGVPDCDGFEQYSNPELEIL